MLTFADTSYLLSIPYRKFLTSVTSASDDRDRKSGDKFTERIHTVLLPDGRARKSELEADLQNMSQIEPYILHTFPHAERFKPVALAINNRNGQKVVCILSEDERHFKIFKVGAKQAEMGDDVDTTMDG